jgi:hypothetical protein
MVDEPYVVEKDNTSVCYTRKPLSECENCQETPIENIFTAHFTATCGKPEWCQSKHKIDLCMELFLRWHDLRRSLEEEWADKFPGYTANLFSVDPVVQSSIEDMDILNKFHGHCNPGRHYGYIPLTFPNTTTEDGQLIDHPTRTDS